MKMVYNLLGCRRVFTLYNNFLFRSAPSMFVSGWEEDRDGVEENSDDEMDTDDLEKMILKAGEYGDLEGVAQNHELLPGELE